MGKRALLVLLPLLVAGGLWLFGRAPSPYARERQCRLFHEERVAEEARFQRETGRLVQEGRTDALEARRAEHERFLLGHRRLEMGGWAVVLVPPGASPAPPAGFLRVGGCDPSAPADAPHLKGAMEIWLAPRGALARLLFRLGLSP